MSLAHNHHHHNHGAQTARAAMASVATAAFLILLKSFAAYETGSVALLGSLADTGFDFLASLLTLFSVRYAALPADDDHRFGHGKAEALSALVQVALVTVSAVLIGWRAVVRLGDGQPTEHPEYGIVTLAFHKSPTSPGGLMLAGWSQLDSQNNRTSVRLANQRFNGPVAANAFAWSDPRPRGRVK